MRDSRDTARVQVALLRQRDVLVHHPPQVFRLGQRRDDLLMLDERCDHVGEHRLTVATVTAKAPAELTVSHLPTFSCYGEVLRPRLVQ